MDMKNAVIIEMDKHEGENIHLLVLLMHEYFPGVSSQKEAKVKIQFVSLSKSGWTSNWKTYLKILTFEKVLSFF